MTDMTVVNEPTLLSEIIKSQGSISNDVRAMRDDMATAIIDLAIIKVSSQAATADIADHETRLRMLERFRYTLAGMALLAGVLAGLLGSWIGAHVH